MKHGSVVVDLAAETGGNIETTRRCRTIRIIECFECRLRPVRLSAGPVKFTSTTT